jgi:hypothetical protein
MRGLLTVAAREGQAPKKRKALPPQLFPDRSDPEYRELVDAREERLARNEILFRDINEQVEFIAPRLDGAERAYAFYCECSNVDCTLQVPMSLVDYEAVRSDATLFVVAPGHELPEIEEVVRRSDAFQVVKKHGGAANLVAAQDPRS